MLHGTFTNRSYYIDELGHYGLLLIRIYYKCFNNGPDLEHKDKYRGMSCDGTI